MFEKRVILAVTIKVTFAVQTITQEIISFLNVLSSGGVSSRARYDEILKAKAKSDFLYPSKRQCDTLLILFVRFLHCRVCFPFKPLRKKPCVSL